jgi:DNA-binding transcriptional ArsR family regulator
MSLRIDNNYQARYYIVLLQYNNISCEDTDLVEISDNDRLAQVFLLQAELCKSLADPKRLMIIHYLRNGPKSVGELAETIGLKQSNTSQHLGVLRKVGVVSSERHGNTVHYNLAIPRVAKACDMVRDAVAERLEREHTLRDVM